MSHRERERLIELIVNAKKIDRAVLEQQTTAQLQKYVEKNIEVKRNFSGNSSPSRKSSRSKKSSSRRSKKSPSPPKTTILKKPREGSPLPRRASRKKPTSEKSPPRRGSPRKGDNPTKKTHFTPPPSPPPPPQHTFQDLSVKSPTKSTKRRELLTVEKFEEIAGLNTHLKPLEKDFLELYTANVISLTEVKKAKYITLRERLAEFLSSLRVKEKEMKQSGARSEDILVKLPDLATLPAQISLLDEIVATLATRRLSLTPATVKKGLEKACRAMRKLIGRHQIKDYLLRMLYSMSRSYKSMIGTFRNIAIYGPSGVGKTEVARMIAGVYTNSFILATDNLRIATRDDFVGSWGGQTTPKTKAVLFNTIEGVLFIDEAYKLAPTTEYDVGGSDAIVEMINFLDKYIGDNVVIVAGYTREMEESFMGYNEGMSRRFPTKFTLDYYTPTELANICISILMKLKPDDVILGERARNVIFSYIDKLVKKYGNEYVFSNQGGDMLNLAEKISGYITFSRDEWVNSDAGSPKNDELIREGVIEFLEMKGVL